MISVFVYTYWCLCVCTVSEAVHSEPVLAAVWSLAPSLPALTSRTFKVSDLCKETSWFFLSWDLVWDLAAKVKHKKENSNQTKRRQVETCEAWEKLWNFGSCTRPEINCQVDSLKFTSENYWFPLGSYLLFSLFQVILKLYNGLHCVVTSTPWPRTEQTWRKRRAVWALPARLSLGCL